MIRPIFKIEYKYGVVNKITRTIKNGTLAEGEFETLEACFEDFIPPEVPIPYKGTKELHEVIQTVENFQQYIADNNLTIDPNQTLEELQAAAVAYFQIPEWEAGVAYSIDDEIRYNNQLYKVLQAHTSQSDWLPDATPALYVLQAAGGTIPEWVQPTGGHDAYNIGDRVIFEGQIWESTINANVWSPVTHPVGWQLVP